MHIRSFDKFPVGVLDVFLVHHRIVECRVDFDVSKKCLHLFDRHSFVDGHGGQCSAEHVRIDSLFDGGFADLLDSQLDSADGHTFMGSFERNEEGGIVVLSGLEVFKQMHLCFCIKIDHPLLVAFPEHRAFPFLKIQVGTVEQDQFSDPYAGREECIDYGKVALGRTGFSDFLNFFIGKGFFDCLQDFHLVDFPYRTLENVVLVLKPDKEGREDAADIVQGDFGDVPVFLKVG